MKNKIINVIIVCLISVMLIPNYHNSYAANTLKIKSFIASCGSQTAKGKTIQLSVSTTGGVGSKKYKFGYTLNGKVHTIKNYSNSKNIHYKVNNTGSYQFYVKVKDSKTTIKKIKSVKVVSNNPISVSLTTYRYYVGETMVLTGHVKGGKGIKSYKFTYTLNGKTKTVKDYSTLTKAQFDPQKPGTYTFKVYVKDESGIVKTSTKKVQVKNPSFSLTTVGIHVGEKIALKGKDTTSGTKKYKFVYKLHGSTKTIKDYSSSKTANFIPKEAGKYQFTFYSKDSSGKVKTTSASVDVVCRDLSVSFTLDNKSTRKKMLLNAQARGGQGDYLYEISYKYNNQLEILQEYDNNSNFQFELPQRGTYEFTVKVKDERGVIDTSTRKCILSNTSIKIEMSNKIISLKEYNIRNKLVNIARNYIGCIEGDSTHKTILNTYNNTKTNIYRNGKYGHLTAGMSSAWCDLFVSSCFIKAGYQSISGVECSCESHISLAKNKLKIWQEKDSYVPLPGDILFIDWQDLGHGDCKGHSDHVGIVERVDNGVITVIEGNKDVEDFSYDEVGARTIKVNGRLIRGFITPKYSSLIK